MERNSLIYKTRRKIQALAYRHISNKRLSQLYFRIVLGKNLNIDKPRTFNEKLQWLKLFYYPNTPLVVKCTDKYAVREYIISKGFGDKLVPLIGKWMSSEEIEWNVLPNQFVLKCNHGCAYNIVCDNKKDLDINKVKKTLNAWLNEDFGAFNVEVHYSKIQPHVIICEKYLGNSITDFKFFCFNGEPRFMYVSNDLIHDRQASIGFFNLDGSKIPITRDDYKDVSEVQLPSFFGEMVEMSRVLAKDFPFVRVDYFLANNTYYFAELTFTPGACMIPLNPPQYDLLWGEMLNISDL